KVIGRTKQASIELTEDVRGAQSHVSRTVIEENGTELHIFRRNTPFGTATEHGTMFIGFSCDQRRLARMLNRMAGAEDGIRDALTRYTTAISGAYYRNRARKPPSLQLGDEWPFRLADTVEEVATISLDYALEGHHVHLVV